MYENIEKLIEISALNEYSVDNNEEIQVISAVDKVNDYLKDGWKLLAINSYMNGENSSSVNSYILGFPKTNSSK